MQTVTENRKMNMKLAQIRTTIQDNLITYENDIQWIFEKINNINYQVVATSYLQSQHPDWIGNTALHFAALENKSEAFDILLNYGADFTIKNSNGFTALHLIMQRLIKYAPKVYTLDSIFINSVLSAHLQTRNFDNPINQYGLSHFHIACAANHVETVKGFLQSGVFIDHNVEMDSPSFPGFTSLHFATKYCAFEVVEILLIQGANIHSKDAKGMTPLHLALERKLQIINDIDADEIMRDTNEAILLLFLNISNNGMVIIDDWGLSDFHLSCSLENSKIAQHHLKRVVNINHTINMDSPVWPGFTALHFAALFNIDIVKLLVKNGADMNIKDAKGVTPLDMCIERYDIEDIHTIVSLIPIWKNIVLLDERTKLSDLIFAMRDSYKFDVFLSQLSEDIIISSESPLWPGCSPLHLAVIFARKDIEARTNFDQANLSILRNVCKQCPSMLFSQDVHGCTPIHLAFGLNKRPVLNVLMEFLEEYPDLDDRVNEDGLSFVHIASAVNNIYVLERLLSMDITVITAVYKGKFQFSPTIYPGSTALHFAVVNESAEAAITLINFGADVYVKDENEMTPIHLLLSNRGTTSIKMANILLSLTNLKDSIVSGNGLSHLHIASWCGSYDAVKQLLDNGSDVNAQITRPKQTMNLESGRLSLFERCAGYSPLVIACNEHNGYETVGLLLKRGADMFVKYGKGVTLLYRVLENYDPHYTLLDTIKSSKTLMARVEAETGITPLHLGCFDFDISFIERSLSRGVNVNAQILPNSPILPGYTALHMIMQVCYEHDIVIGSQIIDMFIEVGADVTLQNTKSETAVHLSYAWCIESRDESYYAHVKKMLTAQRDFSINPTNEDGISHFQIACRISDMSIIQKFLNNADIDINQPIDYFYSDTAGYTALQLVIFKNTKESNRDTINYLDIVDLLLNHGADFNTEDTQGDTPLHECACSKSLDVFERIVRSGADINARNIKGNTPMYYYLESNFAIAEGVKTLIRFGCRLNTYSALTNVGYLANTLSAFSYPEVKKLFSTLIINFKQEMQTDNLGRTAIHNIVSLEHHYPILMKFQISACQYAELIERISRVGCDIDDQDNLGRTALHLALKFNNAEAICGLLLVGANINIIDNNEKTPLGYDFNSCTQCEGKNDRRDWKCKDLETLKALATYVKKLQVCRIDVNEQNEDLVVAFEKFGNTNILSDQFFKELERVKSTKIKSHSLTLYDFLSETGAVADYPRMSLLKRNDVKQFFSTSEVYNIRKNFPELAGILQLQYRKAIARLNLVEPAVNALTILLGFRLPIICSDLILRCLRNTDLKNLIASTIFTDDAKQCLKNLF